MIGEYFCGCLCKFFLIVGEDLENKRESKDNYFYCFYINIFIDFGWKFGRVC